MLATTGLVSVPFCVLNMFTVSLGWNSCCRMLLLRMTINVAASRSTIVCNVRNSRNCRFCSSGSNLVPATAVFMDKTMCCRRSHRRVVIVLLLLFNLDLIFPFERLNSCKEETRRCKRNLARRCRHKSATCIAALAYFESLQQACRSMVWASGTSMRVIFGE